MLAHIIPIQEVCLIWGKIVSFCFPSPAVIERFKICAWEYVTAHTPGNVNILMTRDQFLVKVIVSAELHKYLK